jgi:hypothetical protein
MKTLQGTVLLVQEGRFMLESDQGDSHLFILSHRAGLEPQQLPPLQHRQARVRVTYDEAPHLVGLTAYAVEILPEHPPASPRRSHPPTPDLPGAHAAESGR